MGMATAVLPPSSNIGEWEDGTIPVAPSDLPIFTIGHSTRSIDTFVDLLRRGRVEHVIDIRSIPRSRTNPQYNPPALAAALSDHQIAHSRLLELGGRRPKSKIVPDVVNAYWQNQSFHNYADHALGAEYRRGFDTLMGLSVRRRCAIMCAEAVWWRCHRRIVADYLLASGREVFHLMGDDRIEAAKITPAAVPGVDGLTYPASSPDVRA